MQVHDYDLVVIGSGPAGHRAAIQAAKGQPVDKLITTGETLVTKENAQAELRP